MKAQLSPIALGEKSFHVSLLQQVLGVLGYPVAEKEMTQQKAGESTLRQVRALQKQLQLRVDDSLLVDEATAAALAGVLKDRGLVVASRTFTVTGTAWLENGEIKKRQKLLAFDVDLRGAAIYRTVEELAELARRGGFEFLGEALSDNQGNYRFTFYDWQYGEAERKKADVVVFAVEGTKIVGRSRMVNSEDYSETGLVQRLDVVIGLAHEETEYEALMKELTQFLKESKASLEEIAESTDQLAFTAGELDVDRSRIDLVAQAAVLGKTPRRSQASHEILYGLGRQGVRLFSEALHKKSEDELRGALARSVEARIVREFPEKELQAFFRSLPDLAAAALLDEGTNGDPNSAKAILSHALPVPEQRIAFLRARNSFQGTDFRKFWEEHLPSQPEFRDNPDLVRQSLLTQQLTVLTGNHQALVQELQSNRGLSTPRELMKLEAREWQEILGKTGVPDFVPGESEAERTEKYAGMMQGLLDSAFPTVRIALMVEKNELGIEKNKVSRGIQKFLAAAEDFDVAGSRVHDFDERIREIAGADFSEVRSELMKIQRVFQVSTNPSAMSALLESGLGSAHTIAHIPRKSFIQTYAGRLGGESIAFAIHERASHISTKAEMAAMHVMEYSTGATPLYAMGEVELAEAMVAIENHIPNYAELFGSPDLCECEHCRSVYGPAAYFVDLLRFLWRGAPNADGLTPLDRLLERRPDLVHLPLTCENTNTLIPYVDLVNEVMEYYTAHGSLGSFRGYDTGETTAAELRANPQNFDLEAYRVLNEARYPFTLPYHQPLDVIRTYSDRLNVSRYEALKAVAPEPDAAAKKAIEAEALRLSQEEYATLTGEAFDGTASTAPLHEFFGYAVPGDLESLSQVREFLHRSGVSFVELIELSKTRFINPHQERLDFIERIFSRGSIDAVTLYQKLEQIEAGTLHAADDADITTALTAYNDAEGTSLTPGELDDWVVDHFAELRLVLTLFQPQSKCDLDTTRIRTIESIYEGSTSSGVSSDVWSRMHRFVRLWRKLGWSIHETDLILEALGEDDITPAAIEKLESVRLLSAATKGSLGQLGALWGNIDTYGKKSLYRKLFLNKAVQEIDAAFEPDAWGDVLTGTSEVILDHKSAILAAYRMTEEDLDAIVGVAEVIDSGNPRALDLATDALSLPNLSTIYRYVVLAKALKLKVPDLCRLVRLFGASPFSRWDVQLEEFTGIAPEATWEFYRLAASTKEAGFKPAVLDYILSGALPPDSKLGLDPAKVHQTVRAMRAAFAAIEQDHPDAPEGPLTLETVAAKLGLTFQAHVVERFLGIVNGTVSFEAFADDNLDVVIPAELSEKYTYVNGSGRLTGTGVVSDSERTTLKALPNANASFESAVDALYLAPEAALAANFDGVFDDLAEAYALLLDHPARPTAATLEEKLAYAYEHFIPILKRRLRLDAVTQHIAALIGLSQETTAVLIAAEVDDLVEALSTEGFSASYFSDDAWTTPALERTDETIDFDWGNDAPDPLVPADHFSVRWRAYAAAPASAEYTLAVAVQEADEAFRLYLDDDLILDKIGGAGDTNLEAVVQLNAARMHELKLEYAETNGFSGVGLYWKTPTRALEFVPPSAAYPARILDEFAERAALLHRAARFVEGFALSASEVRHLVEHGADFGGLDFAALDAASWKRIRDYAELRNSIPQAQAFLTDIFTLANRPDPAPTVEELRDLLRLATAWDESSLTFLVDTLFALGIDDFKNEIALRSIAEIIRIVARTGISAQTVALWGAVETDFDALHETAQLMKNTVKAKYEEEDWLELAGGLSDQLRENQKAALVSYLLTLPAVRAWGARDADGLFEYLLIDVQMTACMNTSRIVQASAAAQMFVNRVLLNLESDLSSGSERGVSPGAVDRDRWEWMQNYRVWEANRKVFLYPENWLEPDWRNDRSEFFRELESYLVQNDVTDRSVEQAFRNYLTSLNEVANLEVCGMCREETEGGTGYKLHVFARTHNAPYKFFYRTWNQYRKWSAWEKVPLDIRSVENGDDSGVHLVPVVWKKRLFLFWPEFAASREETGNSSSSVEQVSDDPMSTLNAVRYWEIRLAWGEFVDGKWSTKQVSKEYLRSWPNESIASERDLLFTARIDSSTQELTIAFTDVHFDRRGPAFHLADIQSPIRTSFWYQASFLDSDYRYRFSNRAANDRLELQHDVYLRRYVDHRLLAVDTMMGQEISLESPFFYSDAYRSYFVRPVSIRIRDRLTNPWLYEPYLAIDFGKVTLREATFPVITQPLGPAGPREPVFRAALAANAGAGAMTVARAEAPAGIGGVLSQPMHLGTSLAYEMAFAGKDALEWRPWGWGYRWDTGLEFHTFYHPYSSEFVTRLNRGDLPGLMESDTALPSDSGARFESTYQPNFVNGLVQKPADFAERTYYKENVCFDVYGANSIYNWELFFHAPLYIATRLSRNGRYEEAMKWFHFIFDPTTDAMPAAGESETSRYWKVLPFKTTPADSLEDWFRSLAPNGNPDAENATIGEWRDNPFDPHLVARNRPLAYMKHVVLKYVENLLAWGDFKFRQFTRESVYEALQIYVIANHILGPYPEFVPRRGTIQAETYDSLEDKWDDFSNALVEIENVFPYSSEATASASEAPPGLLGVGPALYFCIPPNDKLLERWDTAADRLYKIRHCQDIDGVERELALFAPPIDPAALIQAASQGLSLGSILADLTSPPPIYRFTHLIQKANELCSDVKQLGSALLAALEKKDAEELGRLRASHETAMLELLTAVRERRVLEAKANKESLVKGRDAARFRLQHYLDLLGESLTVPAAPSLSANLTAESQLPADTTITTVQTDVDDALVESGESGVKLIPKEKEDLDKRDLEKWITLGAGLGEALAGVFSLFPQLDAEGTPLGVGAGAWWGGQNLGAGTSALARAAGAVGTFYGQEAALAATTASYIRREQEWTLQANLAARDIVQIDKQITSADIQIQIAEKELEQHERGIANAKDVEHFLAGKFTGLELYQWMKEQVLAVYKQSYNLAYDLAKKAEKAYKYEMGTETASFIQYGYWDNATQGLVSGDKLQLALRQLERSYLEQNRRELELTKSVSLALLNPLALIELRQTGRCYVSIPEEIFDLDFQGHYFRRLKAVSLTVPCVAGPYTTVNCSLRLLSNTVRINTTMNGEGNYEHENDEGVFVDDDRFRTTSVPVSSIATSSGRDDAGVFEFNFRDERYLPFEGAGAVSDWQIELTRDGELRQFDYATISDVVLHLRYTAREAGGLFKEKAVAYIKDFVTNAAESTDQPLLRMASLKQEFPTEWHRFLHPEAEAGEQILRATLGKRRFPFFAQDRDIVVMKLDVLAKCTHAGDYHLILSYTDRDGDVVTSSQITMPQNDAFGGLNKTTLDVTDAGLNLEDLDVAGELTLKLKRSGAPDYTGLSNDPPEVEDVFFVCHYKLG
jgi:hypothetical protein